MRKKDFNDGTKLGIRLSEDIIKGNIEANKKIIELAEKLGLNIDELKKIINNIKDTQEEIEIEKLFGIVKIYNLSDLEKEEKIILFQILNKIDEESIPNRYQQKFRLNLLKLFAITADETLQKNKINNFEYILENIEKKKDEKLIYKLICEYLYLDEYSSLDDYEDILSIFLYAHQFKETIKTEIELKVKLFGIEILYSQFLTEANINNNKEKNEEEHICLYEKEDKENTEITENCAHIFFGDTQKNGNYYYIETSSFVVYLSFNKIFYLKKDGNKSEELKSKTLNSLNILDIYFLFSKKKITSYSDILYFNIENSLYYFNLDTQEEKLIFNIKDQLSKEYFPENSELEITNLSVEKEILLYRLSIPYSISNLFFYDLDNKKNNTIKISELRQINFNEYFLKNGYLYFISKENIEEFFQPFSFLPKISSDSEKFSIKKYKLNTNLKPINIFDSFLKNTNYALNSSIEILKIFFYNDNIVIIAKEEPDNIIESPSYIKYLINLKNGEIKNFKIANKIEQVEHYKNLLIYNNISKGFKIQKFDIISNKISDLIEKYGELKDANYINDGNWFEYQVDKFSDPELYEFSKEYRRIGKWIFDEINNKIIDIEK
ncbi:hypothetical protein [Fusobacterium hwasookii]|uniref:Uncharacterized protein n=1 Tax=Fusobacterium hwasookii ChDC F206 TaxID=1307443 RepID=A0AAC8WK18_9FUSO|nr:hypothetical protein [Fusobacterium hwasookii]ALQ35429.1 hypothetical protein RN92_05825 [Fusobacterium hwasookii ChDC F206]ALQ37938.1 hypothetical protein RN97_06865 [Fusobacterium hwasookii ChDC F300]QNE68372.1 hypothetical protein H5V38_10745 [Fusobacterium hwasookii]